MRTLIVGGGLAGLALARALGRAGLPFDLVERAETLRADGTGIFLLGNATRALAALGLSDVLAARAQACPSQSIHNRSGRLLHRLDTARFWGAAGPCVAVSRPVLHAALADAVPEGRVRTGLELAGITPAGAGHEVRFSDGSTGRYDFVVGADGLNSTVRSMLFPAAPGPQPLGQRCWRYVTANTLGLDGWTVMLGKGKALLAIPIEDGRLYVYADASAPQARDLPAAAPAALRALFADFAGPLAPLLDTLPPPEQIHAADLAMVPFAPSTRDDALLIGDAAHASSPNMAQGAALSFEDAVTLAAALKEEDGLPRALARFHARQGARVRHVQKQTWARDALRGLPDGLRSFVLGRFGDRLYHRAFGPLLG
ncbi:FAD-dependent monooxygenase [Oceanicella sp. SM1341]|uniref:FAD-dependent monooxygenase n=1 Tax=Oceanicella sp. SM1341 TaxID=1548889 RepID=UPI001300A579|nr:FAD-dependent monooxygenase [Oceanicella sp. SM1341]